MNKASNAVLALCRAFYGKSITENTYNDLISCKNLSEYVTALRSKTVYNTVLDNVATDAAAIEEAVNRFLFERYMSICRYELAIGDGFYNYFLKSIEIDEILKATLHMFGNNTGEYMIHFSPFVDKHVSIDLYALGKAKTFDDILLALKSSEYQKLYKQCMADPNRTYLSFEKAFNEYKDDYLLNLTKKCCKGKEREEVIEIIKMIRDKDMISRIIRSCTYYASLLLNKKEKIEYPENLTMLTKKQYTLLNSATTVDEVKSALSTSLYRDCINDEYEDCLYSKVFKKCKKQIRFSSNPGTVTYCYMFLAENEKRNLIRITEGIRYKVNQEEIKHSIFC